MAAPPGSEARGMIDWDQPDPARDLLPGYAGPPETFGDYWQLYGHHWPGVLWLLMAIVGLIIAVYRPRNKDGI